MAIIALVAEARQQARLLITEHLMTIGCRTALGMLGDDLRLGFPTSLQHISNPTWTWNK
jgi:hypothetical protein